MLKNSVRALLKRRGLQLLRSNEMPFGHDWCIDITHFVRNSGRYEVTTCFDVGANLGQTAERLVRAFPEADTYSFEPVPDTFAQLKQNVSASRQVSPFNLGMSDRVQECSMRLADASGRNRVDSEPQDGGVTVQLSTLDNFCEMQKIDRINLLKIDVEGHEMQVLRGAEGMLDQRRIDFVVCECDFFPRPDEPHGDFYELVPFLQSQGFRIVSFYTGGVDDQGWRWGDVLFAMPSAMAGSSVACSPQQ
jgi:FkbM family methyltransferase